MHSHRSLDGKTMFNFNSDFSGDVDIETSTGYGVISIPGEDLLEFVALCYILPNEISRLEDMDWKQLLKEQP